MSARENAVRQSREARGFHADLCRQCSRGLAAGEVKLFDPRCEGCAEKKARGLRTGDEPRPAFRAGERWVDHGVQRRQRAARARVMRTMPAPRGAP